MSSRDAPIGGGTVAMIMDVDGVVSPVKGPSEWGDDVRAGDAFGAVRVSPSLCARLDRLHAMEGVQCWWLTSWTTTMRSGMARFPGESWSVVADPEAIPSTPGLSPPVFAGQSWWKLDALQRWLQQQPDLAGLVWCDDHLRAPDETWLLHDLVRQQLADLGIPALLVAPDAAVGLTLTHMSQIDRWVASLVLHE